MNLALSLLDDSHPSIDVYNIAKFGNYDSSAKRAVLFAASDAVSRQQHSISTLHLLEGMLDDGFVIPVLERADVDVDSLEDDMEAASPQGKDPINPSNMYISKDFGLVLEYSQGRAMEEAREGLPRLVTAYDFLQGMMVHPGTSGSKMLYSHDADPDKIASAIAELR